MARRRRSYAWSLAFRAGDRELEWLSDEGRAGLDYAQRFARSARERRVAALADDPVPARLTADEIGEWEALSRFQVYQRIKQAKLELFGKELSDRAIVDRMRQRLDAAPRPCAVTGCRRPLPHYATAGKDYCHEHATNAARVRRHRAGVCGQTAENGG